MSVLDTAPPSWTEIAWAKWNSQSATGYWLVADPDDQRVLVSPVQNRTHAIELI